MPYDPDETKPMPESVPENLRTPAPAARKRLSSVDLESEGDLSASAVKQALRETFKRLESFEEGAAKAGDVRDLAGAFGTFRQEATDRDALLFSAIARFEHAQRAAAPNSWGARFWGKVAAMAATAGPALVIAFAHWGVAHQEAFGGLAGALGLAILGVARATTPASPGAPSPSGPPA